MRWSPPGNSNFRFVLLLGHKHVKIEVLCGSGTIIRWKSAVLFRGKAREGAAKDYKMTARGRIKGIVCR